MSVRYWQPVRSPYDELVARFDGRGHPALRATHDKTWEISPDRVVGAGATCVLAVDSAATAPAHGLAGRVLLRVLSRELSVEVTARANPSWRPGGAAVVRRSSLRLPGTLATDADRTAAQLPRELAEAIADPERGVSVTVHRTPGPAVVLLRAPDAGEQRLRAELESADVVVTEDDAAHGLIDRGIFQPCDGFTQDQRILVVATSGLPGGEVPDLLASSAGPVEAAGLPVELAVAARSPRRGPVLVTESVRHAPDSAQLVVRSGAHGTGRTHAAWTGDGPWLGWGRPADAPDVRGERWWCLDGTDAVALDPALLVMARRLRADGAPTKTVAAALAASSGLSRGAAYDLVASLPAKDAPHDA